MKAEVTKRDIEYTLTLTEDEAELLVAILGNQTGNNQNPVLQKMFDALADTGVDRKKWRKDYDNFSNLYVRANR